MKSLCLDTHKLFVLYFYFHYLKAILAWSWLEVPPPIFMNAYNLILLKHIQYDITRFFQFFPVFAIFIEGKKTNHFNREIIVSFSVLQWLYDYSFFWTFSVNSPLRFLFIIIFFYCNCIYSLPELYIRFSYERLHNLNIRVIHNT